MPKWWDWITGNKPGKKVKDEPIPDPIPEPDPIPPDPIPDPDPEPIPIPEPEPEPDPVVILPPPDNPLPIGVVITQVTPLSGPVGTAVTISGYGFGISQGLSSVKFSGVTATITSWSDVLIKLTVPSGAPPSSVILVTIVAAAQPTIPFSVTGSSPPVGNIYYVSLTGSDAVSCPTANNIATPKRTIAAGVACLTPGDTLYIRGGTYTAAADVIDSALYTVPSGTSWANPVTISAYPGETVIIRPSDGQHAIRLTTGSPSYIIFKDFTLDGINQTTHGNGPGLVYIAGEAHHNRLQNLIIKNNSSDGIDITANGGAAIFNEVLNCTIHNNGRLEFGNSGYGIYLSGGSDTLIQGNEFYGNNGYAVHQNSGVVGEGNNNLIRDNRFHDNFNHGVPGLGGTTGYAIGLMYGSDALVYNNLIYNNQGGILVYVETNNAGIYNNTIVGNTNEAIATQYYRLPPILRNNIMFGNGSAYVDYGGITPATPIASNNLTSNPLFVNGPAFNYHLTSPSPARDTGFTVPAVTIDYDGVSRPQGSAYCIGAFEYVP